VSAKVRPLSVERRVRFFSHVNGEAVLPNRAANLIALILVNLAQNALQATLAGSAVTLSLTERGEQILCEVRDEGPGLPPELAANLFAPCKSTKEGGSGIGLAISRQLANHLGADLRLKHNAPASFVPLTTWEPGCPTTAALPTRCAQPLSSAHASSSRAKPAWCCTPIR